MATATPTAEFAPGEAILGATIHYVHTFEFLSEFMVAMADGYEWQGCAYSGLDLETEGGLDPHTVEIATVQIELNGACWVVHWDADKRLIDVKGSELFRAYLESPRVTKIIHNAAFEHSFLIKAFQCDDPDDYERLGGCMDLGVVIAPVIDTMAGEYVLAEGSRPGELTIATDMKALGLGPTVERRYGVVMDKDKAIRTSFRRRGKEMELAAFVKRAAPVCKHCAAPAEVKCSKGTACIDCFNSEAIYAKVKKYVPIDQDDYKPRAFVHGDLTQRQLEYAAFDALWCAQIAQDQIEEMTRLEIEEGVPALKIWDMDNRATEAVARMQLYGIPVNEFELGKLEIWWTHEEERLRLELTAELSDLAGEAVNILSEPQMVPLLNAIGFPVPSYEADELKRFKDDPLIAKLLEWKKIQKLQSTYTSSFLALINPVTHNIHPDFNQFRTATGRFSASKPNPQNIPSKGKYAQMLRAAFMCAPPGYVLVSADYSQIELRLIAVIYGCESLKKAFREDMDLHALTASRMMGVSYEFFLQKLDEEKEAKKAAEAAGQPAPFAPYTQARAYAKAPNFGLGYAAGKWRLKGLMWEDYDIDATDEEVSIAYNAYHDAFPGVGARHNEEKRRIKNGVGAYYAITMDGRRRKMPRTWFDAKEKKTKGCLSAALNHPIQGTSADMMKRVMIELCREVQIVSQIHDELVLICREEDGERVRLLLEDTMKAIGQEYLPDIPIKVDAKISRVWEK